MVKEMPSGGADPCHLSLDGRENFLMAANYTSGFVAGFVLDEQGHLQSGAIFGSILQERDDTGAGKFAAEQKSKEPAGKSI